jgi:hypothetical protein
MLSRTLLLSSAALVVPISPLLAQSQQAGAQPVQTVAPLSPQSAPTTTAPAANTPSQTPSGAAAAQQPDELGDEEDIVITGARPRGAVVGDIPPENTLDARDVRATGATNISELLDAIAPQIGSVRGRGGEAPVLLLNGQRISGFRELRDIPTEAILRVDILPEEVALKYGYRADQKVVNIVLRQRFRSTTAQAGAGLATEGGYANGVGDLTRFLVQRNGRTTLNLHVAGNGMLTEAERNIILDPPPANGTTEDELAARSLIATNRDLRASATFNRQILGNVSATLNTELEHVDGESFIGLNTSLLEPLERDTSSNTAHVGVVLNGTTKFQWHWTLTGNGDLARNITDSDRDSAQFPTDRVRQTSVSGDLTATANGNLFKLPGGEASTTLTLEGSAVHLDNERDILGAQASNTLSRTEGQASVNVDLPISHKGHDFSALGNLTLNGNAEVDQLSDFGTLTVVGAGLNWTPVDRLSFITSWTREEGPPTIQQLGDPILSTPQSRIFDFTTGQTVFVTAITGGNPNLNADRRNVWKLSGNWQPFEKTDFRLRADYVHQSIARPISNITATPQVEAAFPDHFIRDNSGQLVSVDLRPVNFDSSRKDALRLGFDFTKPLKSRRPSQSVLDQLRAQFGFGPRGAQGGAPAGGGQSGGPPPGPPPEGGAPPGGGGARGGGGGGGGGFGGRGGGGFFGGAGGNNNRGRIQFSLTDTITFVDKVSIAPGLGLDYRHGDAAGSTGGTPLHQVEAQLGYFNNGLGARLGANWRSATDVDTLTGDNLHFSPVGTFDLRFFANPGDIPEVAVKHPWLRGTQLRFDVTNIFDTKPHVHDAAGNVPLNYQPDLLNPLGRTIMISIRKLFLPPPSFFRQQFQRQQQQQQQQQQSTPTTR